MIRKESFWYTAASNAGMDKKPDNKPQDFVVQLPNNWVMEGEWDVGLSIIAYPHTWANTRSSTFEASISGRQKVEGLPNDQTEWVTISVVLQIGHKYYDNVEELLEEINVKVNSAFGKKLTELKDPYTGAAPPEATKYPYIELHLTETKPRRVEVKYGGYDVLSRIDLPKLGDPSRELWQKLGFGDNQHFITKFGARDQYNMARDNPDSYIAKYPASLDLHLPALFVYSSIIKDNPVGDIESPLLSMIPIKGKPGELVYERIDRPIYTPLRNKNISHIDLAIKDDVGNPIPFLVGKTFFSLHFKRNYERDRQFQLNG